MLRIDARMAITVLTVYFLTLAVLLWADVVQSATGVFVLLLVLGVAAVAIVAAGRLTRD